MSSPKLPIEGPHISENSYQNIRNPPERHLEMRLDLGRDIPEHMTRNPSRELWLPALVPRQV